MSLSFATDLKSIGHYYTQLTRLMAHWKKVLTLPILDVHYENLVLNFSDTVRQTLDFCDLDWHPAVLDFHNSNRIVHTASTLQVQQPLFSSSIGSAERYNKWLKPLQQSIEE